MNDAARPKEPAFEDLLCFSVYSAGLAFNQTYRPLLEKLGLTYPQYLVMRLLWAADDRTVGELGAALHLKSNTLTPLLKKLEGMDFLERHRDSDDERVVRIILTRSGRALQSKAKHIPSCIARATNMSEHEMAEAITIVDRIRDQIVSRQESD